MRATIRHAASAFILGAVTTLILDAALQFLTATIRIAGGVRPAWDARVPEHGVWIALGVVLWLAAPLIAAWINDGVPRAQVSPRTVWELVGLGMLTLPFAHVLGLWIVLATQLTLSGTWSSDGGIFLSSAYYGRVIESVAPWMGAGAMVRAWARHLMDA
jgi:hypothetical protein